MTDVWDTEAELLARAQGKSIDECREDVILRWLVAGNLRALGAALLRGWMMPRVVQQHLGAMLLDDNEEYCCIDDPTGRRTSHQLIVRQRGPGNPPKPENFFRDIDLVAKVRLLMKRGESYQAAVTEVALETGWGESTVKAAYQKYWVAGSDN
jgi:hypothetical protein